MWAQVRSPDRRRWGRCRGSGLPAASLAEATCRPPAGTPWVRNSELNLMSRGCEGFGQGRGP